MVISGIDQRDDRLIVNGIFAFRRAKKESAISERMLEVLKSILAINEKKVDLREANNSIRKIVKIKETVEKKKFIPSNFGALSYDYLSRLADEAVEKMNNLEYAGVVANEILITRLHPELSR